MIKTFRGIFKGCKECLASWRDLKTFLVLLRVNRLSWVLGVMPEGGIEGDEDLKKEAKEDENERQNKGKGDGKKGDNGRRKGRVRQKEGK